MSLPSAIVKTFCW